jgi:Tfp pilus assembly protein PilZ
MKYSDVAATSSAFTSFVNNGGLRIPSQSVYTVIEYAERVFKSNVCKEGHQITR